MKKYIFGIIVLLLIQVPVLAQSSVEIEDELIETEAEFLADEDAIDDAEFSVLIPTISGPEFVRQGSDVEFSAAESEVLPEKIGIARFIWPQIGTQGLRFGTTVKRKFERLGRQTIELKIKQGGKSKTISKDIFVYDQTGLFVTDKDKNYQAIITQAGEHGIYLQTVFTGSEGAGLAGEGKFLQDISEQSEFLRDTKMVIFNAEYAQGLQNFAQWWNQSMPNIDPKEKLWVQLTESSLRQVSKLADTARKIIKPESIIVTRFSALNTILEQSENTQLSQTLTERGIDFVSVDGRSHTNPILIFSKLTSYFVANGISANVIYLLLAVPFITFVIAFFRQFIGVSTFGVFSPLMLSLSFLLLGFNFGFLSFLVVMIVGYTIRSIFKKVELLYIPRVSLLHSALAISFLPVLGLAVYFGTSINLVLAIFPLMVMATVSEKFVSAQSEGGLRKAFWSAGETVFVSLVAFGLLSIPSVSNAIISTPELILLPVLGNVWLGKFTGLRLSEYFKFRTIFRGTEDEQE